MKKARTPKPQPLKFRTGVTDPRARQEGVPADYRELCGWIERKGDRWENTILYLDPQCEKVLFWIGPYQVGHWGHDGGGYTVTLERLEEQFHALQLPDEIRQYAQRAVEKWVTKLLNR